jgi:hypothetical protein
MGKSDHMILTYHCSLVYVKFLKKYYPIIHGRVVVELLKRGVTTACYFVSKGVFYYWLLIIIFVLVYISGECSCVCNEAKETFTTQ